MTAHTTRYMLTDAEHQKAWSEFTETDTADGARRLNWLPPV